MTIKTKITYPDGEYFNITIEESNDPQIALERSIAFGDRNLSAILQSDNTVRIDVHKTDARGKIDGKEFWFELDRPGHGQEITTSILWPFKGVKVSAERE